MRPGSHRFIVSLLSTLLLAPAVPVFAAEQAHIPKKICESCIVDVQIGQPSAWSLSQAHYLLAQVHEANRGLKAVLSPDALDPNRANAAQLQILRTFLGIEAQFDQSVGVKNQAEVAQFRDKQSRREQARTDLPLREAALRQTERELSALQQEEVALKKEDEISDAARGSAPPTKGDSERKIRISVLQKQIEQKTTDKTNRDNEVQTLKTAANQDISAPNVSTATLSSAAPSSIPSSKALDSFVEKFLSEAGNSPTLSASIALDNYLGMQYEIVAKQLTLLHDEVGPEERVVFLELPTSIYTVDHQANGYLAQVDWKITKYFDREPALGAICEILKRDNRSALSILRALNFLTSRPHVSWIEPYAGDGKDCIDPVRELAIAEALPAALSYAQSQPRKYSNIALHGIDEEFRAPAAGLNKILEGVRIESWRKPYIHRKLDDLLNRPEIPFPITLEMISLHEQMVASGKQLKTLATRVSDGKGSCRDLGPGLSRECVRTLEIIPRQSALNVNEYHATTRNTGLFGVFKWLTGFGAKIDYQSQKEQYDKFLQQEIFASGYGKGSSEFGWTFGSLPGSDRIAPGQRTTYAVLAVPRNTLALELTAQAKAFPRNVSPSRGQTVGLGKFLIRIPGEKTERLWIDSISYVPVEGGHFGTAILTGSNLSPQLGVLVNGVGLSPVRSITRVGSDEAPRSASSTNIEGEFEITNSHEMVIRFSVPAGYLGTPIITLVAPERSTTLNSLPMEINFGPQEESLREASLREPMFIEPFQVEQELEDLAGEEECQPATDFKLFRLKGRGLRRYAEISVGEDILDLATDPSQVRKAYCRGDRPIAFQESTRSYLVAFQLPDKAKRRTIHYRQSNRQGYDEASVEYRRPDEALLKAEVRHYSIDEEPGVAEVDLAFSIPNKPVSAEVQIVDPPDLPGQEPACGETHKGQDDAFRVKCRVRNGTVGARDFMSVRVIVPKTDPRFVDISLPVVPRVASVENDDTSKPEGPAAEPGNAVLRGTNLQRIRGVLFGIHEAVLVGAVDSGRLEVKIPEAVVAAGEQKIVPIVIQTDAGALHTGLSYTYKGNDLEERQKDAKKGS